MRRLTASTKSKNGIARTANGSKSGKSVGPSFSAEIALGSTWPVKVIAETDSNRPSSIEPLSPMNIFAGLKLWGKKPMQMPIKTAVMSDGAPARLKP